MKVSYYSVFQYDIDGISISFPDIPSALTCADNDEGGKRFAKEALVLALHGLPISELPTPTPADSIKMKEGQKSFLITAEFEIADGKLFSQSVREFG